MKNFTIILNGKAIGSYDTLAGCQKRFNKITIDLIRKHGLNFHDVLNVRENSTGLYYNAFPLIKENIDMD